MIMVNNRADIQDKNRIDDGEKMKKINQETVDQDRPAQSAGGFLGQLGRPLRSYRLGDLMVAAGLISAEQLKRALDLQQDTKIPLGKILVQEGYVSAVQLYRKLAEQWCLKASAAGLTLMMQTMTPVMARADDGQQVRLAAAFSPAAVRPLDQQIAKPQIFGTKEIRSNDISAFTKWTTVMRRFEDQMATQSTSPRMQMWKSHLQGLKGLSARDQIDAVNSYINQTRYIEDSANYGKSDYWATPIEFFSKGGDCEDFAVAKYASLRALGFSTDQLRIMIVQDKIKRIAHAILIVYTPEGAFVLDNQQKSVLPQDQVKRYEAVFSINSTNWWLHRGAAGA